MRILVDIGHPAHVHLYKNLCKELKSKGHDVFITVKEIAVAKKLLTFYGLDYINIGVKKDSLLSKFFNQLSYNYKIYRLVKKNNIAVGLGTSITNAHVSRITNMDSVIFDDDDDEVQPLFVKYAHPFCNALVSPDVLKGKRKRKDTIYYPGYHELAYLHPKRFAPDPSVLLELDLKPGDVYFLLRFNAFKAHHDGSVKGLSLKQKLELIEILKPLGRIFITTEREIENELKEYQMTVSPEKAHSLLAYASLLIGDSQTMTSEAAVLGVPSLRCNSLAGKIAYLEEEEKKYELTYAFLPEEFEKLKVKLVEILQINNFKEVWQQRRANLLKDKIDVTSFMVWLIENWPKSKMEINDAEDFWSKFK